ncbi:unnamed protein product [Clonostachys byssicola]|uniref:Dolichyl-diphosphooligosaccharide--protein glycosyltransferase subunit 4 n=1 Tax=Clonostachys byssicola TaxID=160290 RepID=A0A9N9XWL5_9HYPO|nr:unnamed protein product [Clonostachys byssicola]
MRSPRVTCAALAGTLVTLSSLKPRTIGPSLSVLLLKRHLTPSTEDRFQPTATMISDGDLYTLAIFLGSASMVLIVVYHYFEVNAPENIAQIEKPAKS